MSSADCADSSPRHHAHAVPMRPRRPSTSPRSERFVLTVRSEVTDRMLIAISGQDQSAVQSSTPERAAVGTSRLLVSVDILLMR